MKSLLDFVTWVLAISLVTGGVFSVDAALKWLGGVTVELLTPGQQQPQMLQPMRPAVPLQPVSPITVPRS